MGTHTSDPRPRPHLAANAAKATAEHQRRAAIRAIDDPATLARAARIVRAAIERGRLTAADLAAERDDASA